jgi:HEAT repeat protein
MKAFMSSGIGPRRAAAVGGLVRAAVAVATIAALCPRNAGGQVLPFEEVVRNLRHADVKVRVSAMRMLRASGFPEAAAPLAALLTDPVDQVQLEAIDTELDLFLAEKALNRRRVAGVIEVRAPSAASIAFSNRLSTAGRAVPPEVVTGLLAAMRDGNVRVRVEATYAFGVLAPPEGPRLGAPALGEAFDTLMGQMLDPASRQRAAAVEVTGRLFEECGAPCIPADPQKIGDLLVHAINDPEQDVRLAAFWALGQMRYGRAVQALTEQFLYYEHGPKAEATLDALARIADPTSLRLFDSLLADKDPALRRVAVEGIGRAGQEAAAADLEAKMGAERSEEVSLAVAFALERLRRGQHLERLVEALFHSDTRDQAKNYLIELGPTAARGLSAYLQDPSPDIRMTLADTLGRMGDPAVIPALQRLLSDRDPKVVAAAERALARLSRT